MKVLMAQRPAYLNSRYLSIVCPSRKSSRLFVTATNITRSSYQPIRNSTSEDQIARLSSKPLHPLTLADLVKHGHPPLSAEALFASANFTLSLLPARLAHRIQALRNLPFIVVSSPNIARIYNNYVHSLSTLLPYQERQISNLEDEDRFTNVMADLVQTHSNTIPTLAQGFLECRKYISPSDVTRFLDEHLRARIGTRLIAEQHIALHISSQAHHARRYPAASPSYIGVIDTALRPSELIQRCESFVSEICELKYGVRPRVSINGQVNTTFAHVPTHLEYILTELLKNAFRATVENRKEREPVEITIAASPDMQRELEKAPPTTSTSSSSSSPTAQSAPLSSNPGITIRIRDRGGGISPQNLPNIWAYSFTTFSDNEIPTPNNNNINNPIDDALKTLSSTATGVGPTNTNSLAGLGYGLPLGRAYAEYFGGGIAVQSLWGWGTDVYLMVEGLGAV